MTIFRVNQGLKPVIVKEMMKDAPAVGKYYEAHKKDYEKLGNIFSEWIDAGFKYEKDFNNILADARKGYSMADKELKELQKDKKGNKEKIKRMLEIRKFFYETGVDAKRWAAASQPY